MRWKKVNMSTGWSTMIEKSGKFCMLMKQAYVENAQQFLAHYDDLEKSVNVTWSSCLILKNWQIISLKKCPINFFIFLDKKIYREHDNSSVARHEMNAPFSYMSKSIKPLNTTKLFPVNLNTRSIDRDALTPTPSSHTPSLLTAMNLWDQLLLRMHAY